MVKPEPLPRPTMGGGPKVTATPSGTATASFLLSDSMSAKECSSFAVRSSHGFSETNRNAVFDAYAPETSE